MSRGTFLNRMTARLAVSALLALLACGDDAARPGGQATAITTATTDATTTTGTTAEALTTTGEAPTTTEAQTTTGQVEPPPPVCDPLSTCGVQCVDLDSDPTNCGQCGISCVIPRATPACISGQCALGECDDGWFDCDEDLNNGCEQQLNPGQMCGLVCKPDKPELCNLFDDNCDGACDEGALPGCRHPIHRASSPTLGHFYTGDAAEAMSGDFTPESLNYYYLYTQPGAGLVPFYRCLKGESGRRFYTTSSTCENAGPVEGTLGHIATDPKCGAVALFRLYGASNHFYTTSEVERDNAVAMFGYKYEAVAGYVWPAP